MVDHPSHKRGVASISEYVQEICIFVAELDCLHLLDPKTESRLLRNAGQFPIRLPPLKPVSSCVLPVAMEQKLAIKCWASFRTPRSWGTYNTLHVFDLMLRQLNPLLFSILLLYALLSPSTSPVPKPFSLLAPLHPHLDTCVAQFKRSRPHRNRLLQQNWLKFYMLWHFATDHRWRKM